MTGSAVSGQTGLGRTGRGQAVPGQSVPGQSVPVGSAWSEDAGDGEVPAGRDLPLTEDARAKVAGYAKGDAEWAAHLVFVAEDIARDHGWTEIRAEAVKAALLQCWMRERRVPQHRTAGPDADGEDPPAGDGDDAGAAAIAAGVRPAAPSLSGDRRGISAIAGGSRSLAVRIARGCRRVLALRRMVRRRLQPDHDDEAAASGILATLRGERFSYLAILGGGALAVLLAWPLLDNGEEPLPPLVLPPLALPASEPPLADSEAVADDPDQGPQQPAAAGKPDAGAKDAGGGKAEASSRDIREAQTLLARLGYRPGAADGKSGPMTVAAIRAFQRDIGVNVTGVLSPRLLRQLRSRLAAIAPPAEIAKPKTSEKPPPGSPALRTLGRWLGATYDSRRNPAAIEAHCAAVPDNWIFDEAVGDVVHCSRFTKAPAPTPGRDHP